MKVSPQKPSARKNTRASKPQSKNELTLDDVDLIITVIEDSLEDILQGHEEKQETMSEIIEKEMKDIQQAIRSSRIVSTALSSLKIAELGDEPTQLQRLANEIETQLCWVQEEKEQATQAFKK